MQPMPEDWDRAVAVVAHPDDLDSGVASAVARWTRQGKHVSYLLATRGEAGIAGHGAGNRSARCGWRKNGAVPRLVGVTYHRVPRSPGRPGGIRDHSYGAT